MTKAKALEEAEKAFPTRMIRAQLAGRNPEILWYLSPNVVDRLPLDTIDALTSEPKLMIYAERLQNGGLIIMVFASQAPINEVEEMLSAIGALYSAPTNEVV